MINLLRRFFSLDKTLQILILVLLAVASAITIASNLARYLYEPFVQMPIPKGFDEVIVVTASVTAFVISIPIGYVVLTFSNMFKDNEEIALAAKHVSERKNAIFKSLLNSGVTMQRADKIVDLIDGVFAHLEALLPGSQMAIIIDSGRPQMPRSFRSMGISESEQQFLLDNNEILTGDSGAGKTWYKLKNDQNSDWIVFPMRGRKGNPIGKLLIKSDHMTSDQEEVLSIFLEHLTIATENRLLLIELEKLANTDQLTGLFSRNYFQMELDRQIELKAGNSVCDFSILLVDINGLKPINDNIGHVAGDEMIIQGANILQQSCRKEDWACRVGGDEFVVLCPSTNSDQAKVICDHIMDATKEKEVEVKDKKDQPVSIPLRMSVGFASSDEVRSSGVYALADERMYIEKKRFYAEKEKQDNSV